MAPRSGAGLRSLSGTQEHDWPEKDRVNQSHTHNLSNLLALTGLGTSLTSQSPQLQANWGVVKDWNERSRYEVNSLVDAYTLYLAVTDPTDGVLAWLKQHW